MSQDQSLLVVYNHDNGMLQNYKQYSLNTPLSCKGRCNLAAITHSPVGMKKDWKRFIRELGIPSRFLDKNEFCSEYGNGLTTYPCILIRTRSTLSVLVSTDEINRCRELEDLIGLLRQRLSPHPTPFITG